MLARRITALILVAACLAPRTSAIAATTTVAASDHVFWSFDTWSSSVTVRAGDSITWENRGASWHNVVADDGSFRSPLLRPGQSYTRTFTTQGTFTYVCTLHAAEQMVGTVVVAAPGAATPVPSSRVFVPIGVSATTLN